MRIKKCVAMLTVLGLTAGIFGCGGFDVLAEELNPDAANGEQVIEAVPESGDVLADDGLTDEIIDIQMVSGKSNVKQLRSDILSKAKIYERVIFNEKNNGIYFMEPTIPFYSYAQEYDVIFYDLKNDTYKTVYSVTDQSKNYVSDDAIYFAEKSTTRLAEDYEIDGKTYKYNASVTIHKFDLDTQKESDIQLDDFDVTESSYVVSAFGVDSKGRIYLVTRDDELMLFDATGKFISSCEEKGSIWKFCAFDSTNGNFYYEGGYNWVYWGYDHTMGALMAGNVDSYGQISLMGEDIALLYQKYCTEHVAPVEMLNEKYLAILSTFTSDLLTIIDSNAYDYTDVTEQTTTINALTNGVSVSTLNVSNTDIRKFAINTAESEIPVEYDTSSEGTRCVLSENGDSLIVKISEDTLTEYDLETGKAVIKSSTAYPVYDMALFGSNLVAVEKDGDDFYVEVIDWTVPTDYSVTIPSSMKVGESAVTECDSASDLSLDYTYESSDPQIVSVDKQGNLNAWKAGSAVITIDSSPVSVKKSFQVTVTDSALSKNTIYSTVTSKGKESNTIHRDNSNTLTAAYLEKTSSGKYERVEHVDDKIYVETYNSDYVLESTKKISMELPVFGGYYCGGNYRYLVFGQYNFDESDETEVIRVVKYDSNWKKLGTLSIKGANTNVPFNAGGLDMTETDGKLYIHTCHTMYQSSDGLNHQANCTFVINESSMEVEDSYYNVMNLSYGYVSHSFSQYIATDGNYIYRVDLGDAYPRGIAYTKTVVNEKINDPEYYTTLMEFDGDLGNNYTGYALSALELTENYAVIMGAGVEKLSDDQQNIWICAVDKESNESEKIMLTDYADDANINFGAKKLVQLNSHQLLAMWEEGTANDAYNYDYVTKMVLLDESGQQVGDIYTSNLPLGECDPIVNSNGNVLWYTTNSGSPEFVEINPYRLSEVSKATTSKPGDVNADNDVNISDLMQVLNHVSGKSTLTGTAFDAGDVTGDGKVDLQDLMKILNFVSGKITAL